MKMQIKAYTKRGEFHGKLCNSATKDEVDKVIKTLEEVVEDGLFFAMTTDEGKVFFGKEILESAVFEIEVTE